MIRFVLFILVICIPGLTGIAKNNKVLPGNQSQLCQSESSPEYDLHEHSVFCDGIIETTNHEPNPFINIHKHFFSSDQFAYSFKITGSYPNELNLLYFIRKDYLFLSTLRI
jgi:hypothetical protein